MFPKFGNLTHAYKYNHNMKRGDGGSVGQLDFFYNILIKEKN